MVSRGDRGHELVAVGALVVDIHHLAVREVRVGDGDRHRLAGLGLPLGSAVVDGDVVGTEHLLPLRGRALHRDSVHLRLGWHLSGNRELHLTAVGGQHLRALHVVVCHTAGHAIPGLVVMVLR